MLDWWNALALDLQIFYGIGILSTVLLVLQLIMTMMGTDGDAPLDGMDALDAADGIDGVDVEHGDGLGLVSTRTVIAFLVGFGWTGAIARVGAWRGRLADDCEKPHGAGRAHGVYGGADGHLKALRWNLRAGLGRAGDATTSFLGVALELPLRGGAFGLAAAHERMVDHEGAARARHAELYYRLVLPGGLWVLPGLQVSDHLADGAGPEWTAGVRFVVAM